jgi:hypothetical protein
MIFSSSGLTALICSLLVRGSAFSHAEQLTLRRRLAQAAGATSGLRSR